MRRALIIGLDYYADIKPLYGAVNDAHAVNAMLSRHADGSVNFGTKIVTSSGPADALDRNSLRESVKELFAGEGEAAVFYFAGHGYAESIGGYLCASDSRTGDDGLSLAELVAFANESSFQNRIIILDSCHSGIAGDSSIKRQLAELQNGMTILTASTAEQYAAEENAGGVFSNLLVDALGGAAANILGEVTPGSIYAHIDQSLGSWGQRPVFKTNVQNFVSLRLVSPSVSLEALRQISDIFPAAGFEFGLDPTFEPERATPEDHSIPHPNEENTKVFAILQSFNRVGLVIPIDAPHMWHAAMESKKCRLTALGEHYRRLGAQGLL